MEKKKKKVCFSWEKLSFKDKFMTGDLLNK